MNKLITYGYDDKKLHNSSWLLEEFSKCKNSEKNYMRVTPYLRVGMLLFDSKLPKIDPLCPIYYLTILDTF